MQIIHYAERAVFRSYCEHLDTYTSIRLIFEYKPQPVIPHKKCPCSTNQRHTKLISSTNLFYTLLSQLLNMEKEKG